MISIISMPSNKNMDTDGVSVWFACGSCRQSFQKLHKFMEHKIQKHFTAFQNTKCIIFEERAIDGDGWNQNASSFSPPAQSSEEKKANSRLNSPPMIKVENEIHGFSPEPESPHDLLVQHVTPIDEIGNQSSDLINLKYDEPHQDFIPTNNLVNCVEFEILETNLGVKISSSTLKVKTNNVDTPVCNAIGGNSAQKFPFVLLRRLRHISKGKQNSPPTSYFSKVDNVANRKSKNATASLSRSDFTQEQKQDKPAQNPSLIPTDKSGLLQFKCVHFSCGRIFKDKYSLLRHLPVHSSKRPFKCPKTNCRKAFKTKKCIHQHMRAHSDARPFKCLQVNCAKCFKDKLGLMTHGATHSDMRPFKCSQPDCGKLFKLKSGLNCHVRKLHFNTGTLI